MIICPDHWADPPGNHSARLPWLLRSAYHHGEGSLQQTIIGMAQNFVGSRPVKRRFLFFFGHRDGKRMKYGPLNCSNLLFKPCLSISNWWFVGTNYIVYSGSYPIINGDTCQPMSMSYYFVFFFGLETNIIQENSDWIGNKNTHADWMIKINGDTCPICSMVLVYLPTFALKITQFCR